MWNSECPAHIPASERRSSTKSVVVCVMLGEVQLWRYFVLSFLFAPRFY